MEDEIRRVVQDWLVSPDAKLKDTVGMLSLARRAYEAGRAAEARRVVEGREDE